LLAATGVDNAVAHPSQTRVDAEDPQGALGRKGQFEAGAIGAFTAFKHLAEHLHNPITGVHLFQGIFAEAVAEATGGNPGHIVFAHFRSSLKGGQGTGGAVGHDVSP
jgi:hypothetical protein